MEQKYKIVNFGDFYYPSRQLEEGLVGMTIFTENARKHGVPNGSVLIYEDTEYDPSILMSDVGCGISSVINKGIMFDHDMLLDIVKVVDEIEMHIGQGNHFIDFTTGHPSIRETMQSGMIYLHSDFNNENIIPTNYGEAKDLEKKAKDQRMGYLEKLTASLGIPSEPYRDWTHNSVDQKDGQLIYRKGAINLEETDGVGALALNPVDGIYIYAAGFEQFFASMQHGVGRKGSRGSLLGSFDKLSYGIARGYRIPGSGLTQDLIRSKEDCYNPIDHFLRQFGTEQSQIGFCVPEFIVTTKR